jgi:ribonucleoside-diphosphate reductase alpha subunit
MQVVKRNGERESVAFDKVLCRIRKAARGLTVNPDVLTQQVLARIYDGVTTTEIDELSAKMAASLSTTHPDWAVLAAQIAISNHHKETESSFCTVMKYLAAQTIAKTGEVVSYVHPSILEAIAEHGQEIDAYIDYSRDYLFDYFGFKTLEKSYLLRDAGQLVQERPQHLWMRVSLALWGSTSLKRVFDTYDLMSQKFMTHATPTLFNAGTPRQQLSSCYLIAMSDDSIAGIYKTLADCATISKYAGGIGLHAHNIRAKGASIRGTNGISNGIVPMLRVFNNTARYVDQCFTPDTLVVTADGEKTIKSITIDDKVLTHTGEFHEVQKTLEHWWSGDIWEIQVEGAPTSVRVTGEHPILAIKSGDLGRVKLELQEIEYLEVTKLSVGDFVVLSKGVVRKIVSMNQTFYKGSLHDFEIDGPHDYTVAHLGIVHNGGGRRNGSIAIYLEPWHADIEDFLRLKLPSGAEQERARDLFYAMWMPDLFMERVEQDGDWTLFCPSEAPGLADVWGTAFRELYTRYEAEGRGRKTMKAQKLWFQILDTQMETGTPYLVYKDAANGKSNQQNLGTIKSSNLCSEIIEYSDANETAVCNLASIALPAFVKGGQFDFVELRRVVKTVVWNLNRVIDINYYPTPETERSNKRHRPIGLGIQGLADVFAMMKMSWLDEATLELNQLIFEHMYYAAAEASCDIAEVHGSYSSFAGSPASQGRLQPDLWSVTPKTETSGALDWASLRERAKKGMANSLLIAPMPTASTSQILGYNECFEPFTTNIYTRRTLAGEFIVINKYLVEELLEHGLWNEDLKQKIVAANGSVQALTEIPPGVRDRYKTSWELSQKILIDFAAARAPFICQSQSLNLFVADPVYAKLTSMHFYAWKQGLKTGCYYLRTKAPVAAQKFTVDPRLLSAVLTNSNAVYNDEVDTSDDEEEAVAPSPAEAKVLERAALKERLAREYEEEAERARVAADSGEGCLFCSA